MSEGNNAAFSSASDVAKQLITLATGVLALTITFTKDVTANAAVHREILVAAWVVYLASLLAGIWTLLALTGSLERGTKSIYCWNVRIPALAQVLLFLSATVVIIIYAALSLGVSPQPETG